MKVYLKLDGDTVSDFAHEVKACALGQASSSVMARHVIGATVAEIREAREDMLAIIQNVHGRGMQVIGQQIEDPQAAATMWMDGIDFIQGNLVQSVGQDLQFDFHNAVL